jgi:hypothetical protein
MKRILAMALVLALVACLSGCAKARTIDFREGARRVEPYGLYVELFDKPRKDPAVEYKLNVPDVVLSIIFSETIVVPIILCGWYLWEPAGQKDAR